MDPFLDLIHLLRPEATLWSRIDAFGKWGVSFRKHDDLLFCWVEKGECQLLRPQLAPLFLRPDDFVLVRTSTPFTLTSDPVTKPLDSETIVEQTRDLCIRIGKGKNAPVVLRGGKFLLNSANEELLTGLLPQLVHIAADNTSSWRVRSLLKMNEAESMQPAPGSHFVIARLMELLLVEILRSEAFSLQNEHTGLIAGLADPVTTRALSAMHGHVARAWTVSTLARICGVSRSTLAAQFRKVMGKGPIEYLHSWRMALAKDELSRGEKSIGEIALAVGFQSSSAFSTAFTRTVGHSPRRFQERRTQ